jgi:acetyl-CoA carboxylase biotin carboxyl carrier protein
VMKLMQHVAAEVGGVVSAIHRENSEPVEYGSPLFSIAPRGGV